MSRDAQGSRWRRWDPHIHAPGTALHDEFADAEYDAYLDALEAAAPAIEALGVTDYLSTRCYERVRASKSSGRLPRVPLIFPNVECRLSIGTNEGHGVNLHLLVSPEDHDHHSQTARFLRLLSFRYDNEVYQCTEADLRRLGRAHSPGITDDEAAYNVGVNQFKVDFNELRSAYEKSSWMRHNSLVAVAARSSDGTSGLQDETASFAAQRAEIESFAHIIFTATPSNIRYWLGRSKTHDEEAIVRKYGGLKPSMHGCDAHKLSAVGHPDHNRYTWIKGDPTFDSLRQACMEPALRVFVGETVEEREPTFSVASVRTPDLPWFRLDPMPLNPGMVAIIGERGSGKTALADLIAHAADSRLPLQERQTFLSHAQQFLIGRNVEITWSTGEHGQRALTDVPVEPANAHYLTQQFVEQLCSDDSNTEALLSEINRVVFLAHEPDTRMGAADFDSLLAIKLGDTEARTRQLTNRLDRYAEQVLEERLRGQRLPKLQRELKQVTGQHAGLRKERSEIVLPGGKERAEFYGRLTSAIQAREGRVQELELNRQALEHLSTAVARQEQQGFDDFLINLRRQHPTVQLNDDEWENFKPRFSGHPAAVLSKRLQRLRGAITSARDGEKIPVAASSTAQELAKCSLADLRNALEEVRKQLGVDRRNSQRLEVLNKQEAQLDARRRQLDEEIRLGESSGARLKVLFEERKDCYADFFDVLVDQRQILVDLYAPLQQHLSSSSQTVKRLSLNVIRRVDVQAWANRGEELIDLRKTGRLRGRGSLVAAANETLTHVWHMGSAAEVGAAMSSFREEYDNAIVEQSSVEPGAPEYQQWTIDVGRWLYSTEHITVEYDIQFDGVSITRLSPGTRGIVLLLLYLALDVEDTRPLIIDQPEENLDPRSVFTDLVGLFKDVRARRQVIIVTHNANLVVNTDVDQVIVAASARIGPDKPPEFTYTSGGLEDPGIRESVCDILEGGERAFRERAKRLRVEGYA